MNPRDRKTAVWLRESDLLQCGRTGKALDLILVISLSCGALWILFVLTRMLN